MADKKKENKKNEGKKDSGDKKQKKNNLSVFSAKSAINKRKDRRQDMLKKLDK